MAIGSESNEQEGDGSKDRKRWDDKRERGQTKKMKSDQLSELYKVRCKVEVVTRVREKVVAVSIKGQIKVAKMSGYKKKCIKKLS